MNVGKAFAYMFDDPQWLQKLIIGGLVGLIPIINFALVGYIVQIARNVSAGYDRPLPEWNNFSNFFMLGLKVFVISLVYSIPLILMLCVFVPIVMLGGASDSDELALLVGFSGACLMLVVILFAILISFVSTAAMVRFTQTDDLGSAWRFAEVFGFMRQQFGPIFTLWLLSLVASVIAGLGGSVVIGVVFTVPFAYYMLGHVLGQTVRQIADQANPTTQY
jgi:hypothetical protein